MDVYFQSILENLSIDELSILGVLYDEGADMNFKAISNKFVYEKLQISKSKYFNHLIKLNGACLVQFARNSRKSKVYLTKFGVLAVQKITEGVEV